MVTSRAFTFGLVTGLLAACGVSLAPFTPFDAGSAAGGGFAGGVALLPDAGATDAGLPWRTACSVMNARHCETLRRCGLISDDTDDYRACIAWLTATSCGPAKWLPRIEVGTLRYDAVRAETCASDWSTRACTDALTEPVSCQRFLTPAVPLRGACYDGYTECTDGVCRGAACPRSCQPRGAIGEACLTSTDCASTLYCRPTLMTSGSGQCAAYSAENALCGPNNQCAAGLLCVSSVCRRTPTVDQPCLQGRCDEASFCVAGADGGTCEARRDGGLSCTDDVQCAGSLVCDSTSRTCVPLEVLTVGASCTGQQKCPPTTTCLLDTGTCGPPRRADEACQTATECQAHLTCLPTDAGSHCAPRRIDGSPCTTSRDCQVLSTCASGICTSSPTLGQQCSSGLSCLWGACQDLADAGARCIEVQGPGQPCRSGSDCASTHCVQGLCTAACLP